MKAFSKLSTKRFNKPINIKKPITKVHSRKETISTNLCTSYLINLNSSSLINVNNSNSICQKYKPKINKKKLIPKEDINEERQSTLMSLKSFNMDTSHVKRKPKIINAQNFKTIKRIIKLPSKSKKSLNAILSSLCKIQQSYEKKKNNDFFQKLRNNMKLNKHKKIITNYNSVYKNYNDNSKNELIYYSSASPSFQLNGLKKTSKKMTENNCYLKNHYSINLTDANIHSAKSENKKRKNLINHKKIIKNKITKYTFNINKFNISINNNSNNNLCNINLYNKYKNCLTLNNNAKEKRPEFIRLKKVIKARTLKNETKECLSNKRKTSHNKIKLDSLNSLEIEIKNKKKKNSGLKNMSSINEIKNPVSNRVHYTQKNLIKNSKQKAFSFKEKSEKSNKKNYNRFYYLIKHKIKLFLNDMGINNYKTIASFNERQKTLNEEKSLLLYKKNSKNNTLDFKEKIIYSNTDYNKKTKSSKFNFKYYNPQYVHEYLDDILLNLFKEENNFLIQTKFHPISLFKNINGITPDVRAAIINGLIKLQKIFKFNEHTLFLTVQLFDRYLIHQLTSKKIEVSVRNLDIIIVTCLIIASKIQESRIYPLKEYFKVISDKYLMEDMIKMEYKILSGINFDIVVPTSFDFFEIFCVKCNFEKKRIEQGVYFLNAVLLDSNLLQVPGSIIAYAIVSLIQKKNCRFLLENIKREALNEKIKEILKHKKIFDNIKNIISFLGEKGKNKNFDGIEMKFFPK